MELEELDSNPLRKVKWKPPNVGGRGRGRRLMALFACMYYAALHPAEAVGLRVQDCHLPLTGWGRLTVDVSRPEVNTRWTDSGDAHEEWGLKHRGRDGVRPMPIPPTLVEILREHIAEYGTGQDGRLFRSECVVVASTEVVYEFPQVVGVAP